MTATRGIVFLATPFLGTAFKDMPDLTLKVWASLKDQTVSVLIDYTKESTPSLDELVRRFIDLQGERHYHVFAFWEAHDTSLLGRIHMAGMFSRRALLVWYAVLGLSLPFYSSSPWLLILCLLWRLIPTKTSRCPEDRYEKIRMAKTAKVGLTRISSSSIPRSRRIG